MNQNFKDLLIEEMGYKKDFQAKWTSSCDGCGEPIEEGDTFIFMGDKKKICQECSNSIVEELERL